MPNSVILTEYLATLGIEAFALHVFFAKLKGGNATKQNLGMEHSETNQICDHKWNDGQQYGLRAVKFKKIIYYPTEQLKHCEW